MATYGITATGFVRKPLSVIKSDLEANFIAQFGADTDVSSNSVFGKIIGIMAQELDAVWELEEDNYNSFSPDTASGTSLDNAVALTAIARKAATASTVWAILRLQPATTVAALKRVGILGSDPAVIYTLNAAVTDTVAATTYGAWVTIGLLIVGDTYDVLINGTNHTSAAVIASDTKVDILTDIMGKINAGAQAGVVTAYLDVASETLYVYGDPVGNDIPAATFSVSTAVVGGGGGTMAIPGLGSIGYFTNTATGAQATLANTLTDILDGVVGWDGVDNIVDATLGEELETDADLRIRREQSLHVANGGTVEAIRTALLAVDDVDEALVRENITDLIDVDLLPPHSIHCIIDVPVDPTLEKDEELAQLIWETKCAGIATYGSGFIEIIDSMGFPHDIYFSRPASIGILVQVSYRLYDEEIFPAGGQAEMQSIVAAWAAANQNIGMDAIGGRYVGPIFDGVPGMDIVEVLVDFKVGPLGFTDVRSIEWAERASIISADVSFVVIP